MANKPISQPTPASSLPNTPETSKPPRKRKTTEKTTPKNPRTKSMKLQECWIKVGLLMDIFILEFRMQIAARILINKTANIPQTM